MTVHSMFFLPKVIFGEGVIQQVGVEAAALGRRAFVVTHRPGRFTATGIVDQVEKWLTEAGVEVIRYGVEPECSIATFDQGARECREANCDQVIGLGGGSVLDVAKGIAIMATHDGSIRDYQMGQATFERPSLPAIGVPTTAGTGSETSRVVVVGNEEARIKKSINDPRLIPRVALLDPELTLHLPPELTCSIGLDALSHALESYVSLNANPFTEAVALRALELIGQSLSGAVLHGQDIKVRRDMLFASYLAGLSLNAGVGAAHILAQPVSAVTGLFHSQAISILLPHVVQANLDYATEKYSIVAE
ncbi:MAG: iron-containing alcohol dehydrogenase, partial [Chloroflexi bacterium]|nr:iron-containing alcohol dehydrogenase [Chloroflexota bacterium]